MSNTRDLIFEIMDNKGFSNKIRRFLRVLNLKTNSSEKRLIINKILKYKYLASSYKDSQMNQLVLHYFEPRIKSLGESFLIELDEFIDLFEKTTDKKEKETIENCLRMQISTLYSLNGWFISILARKHF